MQKKKLLVFSRVIAYVLLVALPLLGLLDVLSLVFIAVAIPIGLLISLYDLWCAGLKYNRSLDLVCFSNTATSFKADRKS